MPKCIGIVLVMAGVVLLTGIYDMEDTDVTLIAAGAGLLSGMSYALFIFGFKYAAPHGSPQAILVIAFAILAVLLIGLSGITETIGVLSAPRLPLFLLLGIIGGGLSFILYIKGLHYTAPALAAMVAMIEPVSASLFGVVFLDQSLAASQLVGMALIVLTVTALGVYSGDT